MALLLRYAQDGKGKAVFVFLGTDSSKSMGMVKGQMMWAHFATCIPVLMSCFDGWWHRVKCELPGLWSKASQAVILDAPQEQLAAVPGP